MFFSKEADKFLNAVDKGGMRSSEHSHKAKGGRSHYAEGGDVDMADKKCGMRVHRKHKDDGGAVEQKKKGKRVMARSHHADMSEVEQHAKGGRTAKPGFEVEAFMIPDKAKHHRKCHADGGEVSQRETAKKGKRVRRDMGDVVRAAQNDANSLRNSSPGDYI